MFYRWQKEFFEYGAVVFESRARRAAHGKDRKLSIPERKHQRKSR
jgi:hypothetical protein